MNLTRFGFKALTIVFEVTVKENVVLIGKGQQQQRNSVESIVFFSMMFSHTLLAPSRWANLYFLFLVILNWIPAMEVFHREITMLPLAIVLFIIMVKDGMEDFKRHRFDRERNCSNIRIYERLDHSFVFSLTNRLYKLIRTFKRLVCLLMLHFLIIT